MDRFPPPDGAPQDPVEPGRNQGGQDQSPQRDVLAPPPGQTPQPPEPPTEPVQQLPPPAQTPPESPEQPAGTVLVDGKLYVPAGLWPRVGAFAIDFIILSLLGSILMWIANAPEPDIEALGRLWDQMARSLLTGGSPSDSVLDQMASLMPAAWFRAWLSIAMCGAYFTLMHGLAGTTLGKLCYGLTVLRRDGSALGVWLALGRYLLYFLFAKLAYTAWLIPFNAERRTLYDIFTSTNVFREAKK